MKMLTRWLVFIGMAVLMFETRANVMSQQLGAVPDSRYARLTRGVSIPQWFWMIGGQNPTKTFQSYISDQDVRQMQCVGIQHVRLPIDIQYLFDFKHPNQLVPTYLPILDAAIQRFLDHNIAVIIVPFGDSFTQEIEVNGHLADAATFWRLFAQHLSRFNPEMVFPEVANEPTGPSDQWQGEQQTLISAMREGAPNNTLIATAPLRYGNDASQQDQVRALTLMTPLSDPNVIYSVHFYDPYIFTQQGAEWVDWLHLVHQVPYPSTLENTANLAVQLAQSITDPNFKWVPQSVLDYGRAEWSAGTIAAAFMPAINWAHQNNARIIVDEFGVYRKGGVDPASRTQWLSDVRNILEGQGIGWAMWDYDGGFSLMNDADGQRTFDPATASALGLNLSNVNC